MSDFAHVHAAEGDAEDCPECLKLRVIYYMARLELAEHLQLCSNERMAAMETLLREVMAFNAPWGYLSNWQDKALARFPHLKKP